jgi:hypothetical protein
VRLVHDHQLGAGAEELLPPPIGLDVIHRDDDEGVDLKEGLVQGADLLQAAGRAGKDELTFQVELQSKLALPLLCQVRRAQDGKALDLAPVEEFPGHQAGLDRLADAHVIRDEEPDRILPQGHEEGDKLVRPGIAGEMPEGTERPGAVPEPEPHGVPEEPPGPVVPKVVGTRGRQGRLLDRFQPQVDPRDLVIGPAEGTQNHEVGHRLGEDHPLPPASPDEGADGEAHAPPPKTDGYFLRRGSHSASCRNRRTM